MTSMEAGERRGRHAGARRMAGARFPAAGALAVLLAVPSVYAQPEPGPAEAPRERASGPSEPGEQTPEMLRRMVERQLERSKRVTSSLEEVQAMIDRGEPADAVRRRLREVMGTPGGPGGGFGGGPGERLGERFGDQAEANERPIDRLRRRREAAGLNNQRREDSAWAGLLRLPEGPGTPPGGPPGAPPGPGPGENAPANDEPPTEGPRLDEIIRFVEKSRPEMARRLRELRDRDPEALRVFMRDKGGQIVRFMREEREQPGLWEARRALSRAERESFEAARDARGTEGDARDAAVERLRKALEAQFEARLALARREVDGAKVRLERLSKQVDEATTRREAFLRERLEKALAGEELMNPPTPPGGGPEGAGRPAPRRPDR